MWHAADPVGLRTAIARWHGEKSTLAEREASRSFVLPEPTFGCSECGQFSFAQPTVCFWCRHPNHKEI